MSDPTSRLAAVGPRLKMTLAYDGTAFHGWQKQEPPHGPALRTVSGVVEGILQQVFRQPIDLVGASRTDAGVHAEGQVAHFNAQTPIPQKKWTQAINSRLPDDVEVRRVEPTCSGFDAISDAISKQYRYRLFHTTRRPLQKRHCVWHCWTPLNLEHMNDAARRLVGTHDFEGFAAAGHGRTSTTRTVLHCRVERHDPEVVVVIAGTGFLYHMVRIITGTLVEVGRGRLPPQIIDQVLESKNRRLAGPTAPPQGLCLEHIVYPSQTDDGSPLTDHP